MLHAKIDLLPVVSPLTIVSILFVISFPFTLCISYIVDSDEQKAKTVRTRELSWRCILACT